MTDETTHAAARKPPIRFHGRAYPVLTIEIADAALPEIEAAVAARIAAAPSFFWRAPVVLDLTALPAARAAEIEAVTALMRRQGLAPAAFRARGLEVEQAALGLGLGRVLEPQMRDQRQVTGEEPSRRPPVIVTEPVRSGRRIYAAGADLIVLHSVSPGAELLADGCIHVYGALRGAAHAGVCDDPEARIFAKAMDAELVSVAGLFLGAADFPPGWAGQAAQVRQADGLLRFEPLTPAPTRAAVA